MTSAADSEFQRKLNGLLFSLMSWEQLSTFWGKVDRHAGWYLYAVGEDLPSTPANADQVQHFMENLDALLHREHHEKYCGIVYADNLEQPGFVKIYDPAHLGSSCGSSKNSPLPGWVMSLVPPEELKTKWVVPANRKRWWQNLFNA
ncbi:MAG: hypothetical protein KGZ83_15515 [Sulfuricella sp.]|nr:hypothetical protein [Sulfuricella sp.]